MLNTGLVGVVLKKKDVIDEKYKIYTKEFDLSLNAKNLASKAELNFLRKKFENEYFENKRLINKLAKKLERLFSSLNINSWKFDQDEGYIDPTRLANLVANSGNLQIFKSKNEAEAYAEYFKPHHNYQIIPFASF